MSMFSEGSKYHKNSIVAGALPLTPLGKLASGPLRGEIKEWEGRNDDGEATAVSGISDMESWQPYYRGVAPVAITMQLSS